MNRSFKAFAVLLFSMLVLFETPLYAQTVLVSPPPSSSESAPDGRPWLGVAVQDINPDIVETMSLKTSSGVLVSEVSNGSPADKAGVVPGDVIVTVNGKNVLSSAELVTIIQALKSGSPVVLGLNRSGETERISVVLGTTQESSAAQAGMMPCAGAPGGCMHEGGGCAKGMHAPPGQMGGGCCMHGGMSGGCGGAGIMGMPGNENYGKMYLMALKGLDLTEDQQKKVRALKSDYIKNSIKAGADIGVAEVELKELLAAETVNLSRVKSKINEIGAKKAELRFLRIKSLEDLKKILTPEQRKNLGAVTAPPGSCPMTGGMEEEGSGR